MVALAVLGALALVMWFLKPNLTPPVGPPTFQQAISAPGSNSALVTHPVPRHNLTLRAVELTEAQRENLAKIFQDRLKPAVEEWCRVYSGRVPFRPEDVTLDKFHSRLGANLYTFMIGNTTLTIKDMGNQARVNYMMTRDGAGLLNSPPIAGAAPDLTMPVSRAEITSMLEADSGIQYPPDQVQIHPTSASGALTGGVSVEAGGITGNGVFRAMTLTNLDFVIGPDGRLVYYLH
jgi:hypothetical protein